MIGLDTNVLVRYIMQDDAKQSPKATRLVESLSSENPGFVPVIVIVELFWVLSSCYDLKREQLSAALDALLRTKELVIDRAEQVLLATRAYGRSTADFPDCLIERISSHAGCAQTMTFDSGASKLAGMTLIS
jgi:predicted nucleic-acid-binding protein